MWLSSCRVNLVLQRWCLFTYFLQTLPIPDFYLFSCHHGEIHSLFSCGLACFHTVNCFTNRESWTASCGSSYFHIPAQFQHNPTALPPFSASDNSPDEVNLRIWVINQDTALVVYVITAHTQQLSAESDWSPQVSGAINLAAPSDLRDTSEGNEHGEEAADLSLLYFPFKRERGEVRESRNMWKIMWISYFRVHTMHCSHMRLLRMFCKQLILCQRGLGFHTDDLQEMPLNTFSRLNWNQFHCDAAHYSKLVPLRSPDNGSKVLTGREMMIFLNKTSQS